MAACCFNIVFSVVAAPTGHHRTPTPKPDRNGRGVRRRRTLMTGSLRTWTRHATGATPDKHIDPLSRRLSDKADSCVRYRTALAW